MLNKDEAERLAAEVLAMERARHPRRQRGRIVWFMGLWRIVCPDLGLLTPDAARDVAYKAMVDANASLSFRLLAALLPLVVVLVGNRLHVPLVWMLSTVLLVPALYAWLVRRGIEDRLPEALAAGVEVGEV